MVFWWGAPKNIVSLAREKQEIKNLKETVTDLMTLVKEKEEICLDLQRKLKTVKADLDAMKSSCHEEEIKITRQEQDVRHIQQEVDSLDQERQKLSNALADMDREIQLASDKITALNIEDVEQTDLCNRQQSFSFPHNQKRKFCVPN